MAVKKLLLVDDQPEIILSIARELKARGEVFEVINAVDGVMAVTVARKALPDLIVMDWDMPRMNGLEAIAMLKLEEATAHIPVIIATGRNLSANDLRMALQAGAVDYVRKPLDFVELLARIKAALRLKAQHQEIQGLLTRELELKTRQLSAISVLNLEKTDLLSQLIGELEACEDQAREGVAGLDKKLKGLRKGLQSKLDFDDSWETYKLHFEEVHPQFFAKLQQAHPQLGVKDLKLCAYLKLGLENKQIANMLNITSSSARTALTRLKKKLSIPESEDLRTAISNV